MKQEFEMQQSEMDEILRINKEVKNLPLIMIGTSTTSGREKAEAINRYWETLGEKYEFDWETVEGSSKGALFFLATPKPKVVPKTQSEIEIEKYIGNAKGYLSYEVKEAIKKIATQLESCNYECEGGYLKNNIAFVALKELSL
jgi:hypothetical protein